MHYKIFEYTSFAMGPIKRWLLLRWAYRTDRKFKRHAKRLCTAFSKEMNKTLERKYGSSTDKLVRIHARAN